MLGSTTYRFCLIVLSIITYTNWSIAVTPPKCTKYITHTRGYCLGKMINYLKLFNCVNVTNDFLVKWNFEEQCQTGYDFCSILNITNSNFNFIDKKLNDMIKGCKIIEVDINHSNIQTISADAFSGITSIRKLNLNFNAINNIDFLANSLNLIHIDLSYNKITIINSQHFKNFGNSLKNVSFGFNNLLTIGSSIYHLSHLTELYLNNNNLSKIGDNVLDGVPNLEILNIAYNYIEILEQKLFKNLNNLKIINLEGNQIKVITYFVTASKNTNIFARPYLLQGQKRKANTELYLQNNPLTFRFNETYWNFNKELFKLDLSRCNVSVLKNVFQNLTSLEILKLRDSSIEDILPNTFSSLIALKELDLHNNKLTTLHKNAFAGLTNLKRLDLSLNPIKEVFQSFSKLTRLLELNITVQHASITNNTFRDLKIINKIYFMNSSIVSINSGSFSSIRLIQFLNLENSTIQKIQPKGFENLTFRTSSELNLKNNFLTVIESNSFYNVKFVKNIYLQNNLIENIYPGAFNGSSSIDNINLNNNNLWCILNDTFTGVTRLRTIFINNNKLSKIELHGFRFLDYLQELDLSQNNIKAIDGYTFSYLKNLVFLNLTYNKLTTLYSNSFYNLINLNVLDLSNNNINEFPLGTFNNILNLITLNLEYNGISKLKVGSFSNLGKLTSLDLSNNNLIILNEDILYPLPSLKYLDLSSNELSSFNVTSLLFHLPRLRFIYINDNNWECQLLTVLLKKFKLNRIDYLYDNTENYTTENVDGIPCYENLTEDNDNNTTSKTSYKENDMDLFREYFKLLINKTKMENTKNENFVITESQNSRHKEFSEDVKIVTDSGTNITNIFILIVCLGILLFQIFKWYKKYNSQVKSKLARQSLCSEIELLNNSSSS